MNPQAFVQKWKAASGLTERAASQQHFLDLCDLLDEKKPADVDPTGTSFTFEKGVTTTENKKGFADVWRRGCFGWEYKGKHKDLTAAYNQLLKYREALENPPVLVVCDLDRFVVRTNFTGYPPTRREFDLDALGADPKWVALLRKVFTDPYALRPDVNQEQVTAEIAARFTRLASGMRTRGVPPADAAHFLMKLMFCMFAEDIHLLPSNLFESTVRASKSNPARLTRMLADLFARMAEGGYFGVAEIAHFNGGLFADADVIPLEPAEIVELLDCAECDWSAIEPSIFGTLFERCLDPDNRTALGAHYTSVADIETLLGPVLRDPLRREWDAVRAKADALWEKVQEENKKIAGQKKTAKVRKKVIDARAAFDAEVMTFLDRLAHVTVLDPACGSGNFLYVALRMLLDLEKEVVLYANTHDIPHIGLVGPHQLHGIERNEYAQQLAQVVIWIGYLQWMKESGVRGPGVPVLDKMDNIERRDAILDLTDPAHPKEPDWPDAEFIVGNPPFLGGKMLRANLGDDYVKTLFSLYGGGGGHE